MKNPELVRNLWLVHSPIWLAILPFLLAVAFLVMVAALTMGGPEATADRPAWEVGAFGLFAIVTILYGSGLALNTINAEVRGHTWDGQRMSAIPPWSMAWGKLFGSTALAWYGGLICILLYAYFAHLQSIPVADVFKNIVVWILAAVIAQSATMLSFLVGLLRAPIAKREQGISMGTFVAIPLGYLAVPLLWVNLPQGHDISWLGWQIGTLDFLVVTAAAYAAWALTGLYFAMRREFQYINSPLAWLGFAIFTIVYVAGFERGAGDPLMLLTGGFRTLNVLLPLYAGAFLLYVIALAEPTDWRAARRIGRSFARRDWREIFDQMPRAVYTLALLAAVVGGLVIAGDESHWPVIAGRKVTEDVLIAALLFAARDIGLILLLAMTFSLKSSELLALGYLIVVHGILPASAHLFADPLLPLFWPVPNDSALFTVGPALMQVVAVYVVLGRRIRSIHLERL